MFILGLGRVRMLADFAPKVFRHGRYVTFQLAEVAAPRSLFQKILSLIDDPRRRPIPAWTGLINVKTTRLRNPPPLAFRAFGAHCHKQPIKYL